MRIYFCQEEEAPKDSIVCVFYILLSTHLILAEMVTDGVLLRFDAGSLKSRVLFKLCNDI